MSSLARLLAEFEARPEGAGPGAAARRAAAALGERVAGLEPQAQLELRCATLLPGIGLPAPSSGGDLRPSAPSRARAAAEARSARVVLWEGDVAPELRERVCQLIALRGLPAQVSELRDPERALRRAGLSVPLEWLALLAEAEAEAHPAPRRGELAASAGLFRELVRERGLADEPFPDDWTRFRYFRDPSRAAQSPVYDASRCEVLVTSGPPGVGKSTWCARERPDWPRVSLDELRAELNVSPTDGQGPLAAAARERARTYLREGRSFVWEGTNLSRDVRRQVIDLCDAYAARVRVVCVEAPAPLAAARNRARPQPVPAAAIARMLRRWEFPDRAEAWRREVVQGA